MSADTMFSQLNEVVEECKEPNWDSYGALAVDEGSIDHARRFVLDLHTYWPLYPIPDFGVDPDGCVTLDWDGERREDGYITVSIGSDGARSYAATIRREHTHGAELAGVLRSRILNLLAHLYAKDETPDLST